MLMPRLMRKLRLKRKYKLCRWHKRKCKLKRVPKRMHRHSCKRR